MGIINITPDSFSDGGNYIDPSKALKRAKECIAQGAEVIDIGGQSTRPGAEVIQADVEIKRILPVVKLIRKEIPNVLISLDTFYSEVASKALDIGIDWINDISGGRLDPEILNVVSHSEIPFVITHSRGNSLTMNKLALYKDVFNDVFIELMDSVDNALAAGLSNKQIIIDPGLGFAKNDEHNLSILSKLEKFTSTSYPVLVGPSRKRFIGNIISESDPKKRIFGTNAVLCRCVQANVDIVRVHDVKAACQTIAMSNHLWNIN